MMIRFILWQTEVLYSSVARIANMTLFALSSRSGGFLGLNLGRRGDRPFLDLQTNTILAGLEGDGVLRDLNDLAGNTADGGDFIAKAQRVAHLLGLFLFLILRTDNKKIEDGKHQDKHDDHGAAASGSRSSLGKKQVHSENSLQIEYDVIIRYRDGKISISIKDFSQQ